MSRRRWASSVAAAALAAVSAAAAAAPSLCLPGEPVVFACAVGSKSVALCRPDAARQALIYRFGRPGRLELVVPAPGESGEGVFRLSNAPLIGGGETSVVFTRGGYEYRIYSKVSRSTGTGGDPEFEDGIVVARDGRMLRRWVCDDGGAGFLQNIDWLPPQR